jgi:hypothetical protein
MVTKANEVTNTRSKLPSYISIILHTTTEQNPPKADYCCGRGNGKPKKGYHHSNKYYLKH